MDFLSFDKCAELKAAGFPQETVFYHSPVNCYQNPPEPGSNWYIAKGTETEYDIACPTSDELMAAFEADLSSAKTDERFFVAFFGDKPSGRYQANVVTEEHGFGNTPAEALANLWIRWKRKK